jgi:flagellar biosynthesis chaperone FliJ
MQDKQRKLRQLDAAMRLRALQREKAELGHGRTRRALSDAERLLREEQARYASILTNAQQQMGSGVLLDPFLHEQRLLTQLVAHSQVQEHAHHVASARAEHQHAMQALLKSKVDEDIAGKAHSRVADELLQYARGQEQIDIADAQQAQGGAHGL